MTANTPADVIRLWVERFNGGDIEGLRPLYEDGAVLTAGPGAGEVHGVDAILDSWRPFAGSTMAVHHSSALVLDELALTQHRYTFTLPDGTAVDGCSVETLRRQPDGGWRYVLCNPYGDALVAAPST